MRTTAWLLGAALLAGCGEPKYDPPKFAPVVPDPATAGTIAGTIRYQGPPPPKEYEPTRGSPECALHRVVRQDLLVKDGRLRNAFVHVKQGIDPRYRFPIPEAEHLVANEKCLYEPRVSGARVWQRIVLVNKDPTQHNFRSDVWSKTLFGAGQKTLAWFEKPRTPVALRCDLHNWMLGHLWVLDHPYFAVTGEDGAFRIDGLPSGEYVVEVWHETLGTQTHTVRLEPRGSATLDVEFKSP